MMNSNTIEQAKHNGQTDGRNGGGVGYPNQATESYMLGSPVPSIHPYIRRIQAISTGIFLALLILIVILVIVFRSKNSMDTAHLVITNPSLEVYYSLLQNYPQSLECSCSNIAIPYGQFMQIDYTLHPVCSSIFISDLWIDYLSMPSSGTLYMDDFRLQAPQLFQALKSFCGLADQFIRSNLPRHLSKEYISMSPPSPQMFSSRMSMFFQEVMGSVASDFLLSLQLIKETTQANALLSGTMTNYYLLVPSGSSYVSASSRQFNGNCTCSRTSACVSNAALFLGSRSSTWNIPGFVSACYNLESLQRSDLRCLFLQSCLDTLNNYLQNYPAMNLPALDSSTLDRFTSTDSVNDIVTRLMVEAWILRPSYANYYAACQPKTCSYSVTSRREQGIEMVTTVLATIGGIAAILNIFIFVSNTIILECIQRKARNSITAIKHPGPSYIQY